MGLDYLNKKIWHPGSMKNIQKVWEAEQKQHEIIKRNKERGKKLLEEKHNEDLKRGLFEAGLISRAVMERMDWMYEWGNKLQQQQQNKEEYLTGNKVKKDFKQVSQEECTNKKCQDFVLLNEDPMFIIAKMQKERRDALKANPVEMKKIVKEAQFEWKKKDKKASLTVEDRPKQTIISKQRFNQNKKKMIADDDFDWKKQVKKEREPSVQKYSVKLEEGMENRHRYLSRKRRHSVSSSSSRSSSRSRSSSSSSGSSSGSEERKDRRHQRHSRKFQRSHDKRRKCPSTNSHSSDSDSRDRRSGRKR